MTEQTGMHKTIPIVPLGPSEAHLQNEVTSYKCYICKELEHEDMVLLRTGDKKLSFACLDHPGVVQEFIRQFGRAPLGWTLSKSSKA